jgi:putative DNA primase/helicase
LRGTDDELEDIKAGLNARLEDVCEAILGNPTTRSRGEWRWGRKGAVSIIMSGPRRGLCSDFEGGDKATDILGFIRTHQCGGDWKRTLDWARGVLGIAPGERPKLIQRPRRDQEAEGQAEAEKIKRAREFWAGALPINGTHAEQYLNAERGIPTPAGGWPDCVRYHPARRALILAATTASGAVQAVQLVHLTEDARKRPDEPGRPTKQSFGPQAGAVVRLPAFCTDGIAPDALQTAEGPETGLSVWASTGRETWIALGSAGKLDLPRKRRVVLCADDDPKDAQSSQAMRKAYGRWISAGLNVVAAFPWQPRRFDKSDFNDLLKQHGIFSVRARIIEAVTPKGPPPSKRQVVELGEGGRLLREAMEKAREAAIGYDPEAHGTLPPVHAIRITVGGGKSHSGRNDYALALLARIRAAGGKENIAMSAPTHKLANEQAEEFNASPLARSLNLTARVGRGRNADDPEQPGMKMCHDYKAVQDAYDAGVSDIQAKVCRNTKTGDACPLAGLCGYQKQRQQRADFWIVPHEMMFKKLPAYMGKLAALIVDEAMWQKGLEGVDRLPIEVRTDSLNAAPELPNDPEGNAAARLRECHRLVSEALASHPEGPLSKAHMVACGITEQTAKDGTGLSWRRVVEPDLRPGMTAEERRAAMVDAGENRHAIRMAGMFSALQALMAEDGPEFSGWLALATSNKADDGPARVLRRKGRHNIAAGWQVPTVIIDALLDPDLLRPYWPQVEVTADIEIQAPHQHVYQVVDQAFAKSRLVPSDAAEDEAELRRLGMAEPSKRTQENDRRDRNAADVLAVVRREAVRRRPAKVLAVAQLAVEERWRALGNLPRNLDLAHHNAVAGRDEWKAVPLVAVIGRTLPPSVAVEKMAEALTGKAVAERVSQYQKVQRQLVMQDGSRVEIEADCHPDAMAEAIRWQICEGELIQIIGRGRGVRRTPQNPLTVLVMTNVALPIPLGGIVTWADLAPSHHDRMLSERGFAPASPADAAACFPHFWPNPNAAKQAFHKERSVSSPIKDILNGESNPPLPVATYQKAGAGKKPASVSFDPERLEPNDLRAVLEDDLGELAWFRVEGDPDQPPEPEPPPAGDPKRPASSAAAEQSAPELVVASAALGEFRDKYAQARAREGLAPGPDSPVSIWFAAPSGAGEAFSDHYARAREAMRYGVASDQGFSRGKKEMPS